VPAGQRPASVTLLDLVGLSGLQRRYPHELSGGQQQRVARALALSPSLVLLDEPFASLDAALRVSIRTDIARVLRAAGTAVVLVTHDQQEALSLADQVAVPRQGRIAQAGPPRDLYARPADPELAQFLAEANLVPAKASSTEVVTALGRLPWAGESAKTAPPGDAIALIRPEQLTMSSGGTDGLECEVAEQTYHGHDSLVTVRPLVPSDPRELRVRVPGGAAYPPGTTVRVTAAGTEHIWPAPGRVRRTADDHHLSPPYWPGASQVDIVGVEGFPNTKYGSQLGSFSGVFGPVFHETHNLTRLPISIAETDLALLDGSG
jgi:iron(III) transport system ATP-binding protein